MTPEIKKTLILLRFDSNHLYDRILLRFDEYIDVFSRRRTREHFKEIFKSRYDGISFDDLRALSEELIVALDRFYSLVKEMDWYFYQTEDMPSQAKEKGLYYLNAIKESFAILSSYLEAELNGLNES